MKILLTGAGGMLGQVLVAELSQQHDVLACSRATLDVTDRVAVTNKVQSFAPDLILHAAAYTNVETAETDPDAAYQANMIASQNLAESLSGSQALMIYISSTGVYGLAKAEDTYTELDEPAPTTHYHRSKLAGEQVTLAYAPRALVLRTGWLFGGDKSQAKNFVYKRYLEAQGKTVMHSDPTQRGNPTYVLDLVAQIRLLIDSSCLGVYNCVNDGAATRLEYVQEIISAFSVDCRVEANPDGAFERVAPVSPNESASNYLLKLRGLDVMPNWKTSLKKYVSQLSSD